VEDKIKNRKLDSLMMRSLQVFLIFILVAIALDGMDYAFAKDEPHLIAHSVNGTLQIETPGAILIEIKNDAFASEISPNEWGQQVPIWLQGSYFANATDAIGITAELRPRDSRIKMLSGPQLGGSLASGRNQTLKFNALTEELAEPGVYAVDLIVTYRKLSNVTTSGDPVKAYVVFKYQNISQEIPLSINVIQGPRLLIDEVKDNVHPGKESVLNLVFVNSGDSSASDIRIQVVPQPPFSSDDGSVVLGSLEPGHFGTARFRIKTENETIPGEYALLFSVIYLDKVDVRNDELTAIVTVNHLSSLGSMQISVAAGFVLLAALIAVMRRYWKWIRRRIKRITKK
jgi:hypothetical protein